MKSNTKEAELITDLYCTGCGHRANDPLGMNESGEPYLACCPDNKYTSNTSVEELLKPRYKVIADYPYMETHLADMRIGRIVTEPNIRWLKNQFGIEPDKFPRTFRKLEWWEERTEDQMPEYVRLNDQFRKDFDQVAKVVKSETHECGIFLIVDKVNGVVTRLHVENFWPITEQEYLTYQNQSR